MLPIVVHALSESRRSVSVVGRRSGIRPRSAYTYTSGPKRSHSEQHLGHAPPSVLFLGTVSRDSSVFRVGMQSLGHAPSDVHTSRHTAHMTSNRAHTVQIIRRQQNQTIIPAVGVRTKTDSPEERINDHIAGPLLPSVPIDSQMKVLIVGCGLAGLATALGLVTKATKDQEENDLEIVIVERRHDFQSRGATFGLAPNGQIALQEIAPASLLEQLKELGVHMSNSGGGYMLPWWTVRDAMLEVVKHVSPYKDCIRIFMGCVVETVENIDKNMPLSVSFAAVATSSSSDDDGGKTTPAAPMLPEAQSFDLLIGADGVHSQIRTEILKLAPPVSTDTYVWRGSVNLNASPELSPYFEDIQIAKLDTFGSSLLLAIFNFSTKVPGMVTWVLSCNNAAEKGIVPGKVTTPLDLLEAYKNSLAENERLKQESKFKLAELLFRNTQDASDLTWSTEMAVVDLDAFTQRRWGGTFRATLVGDAAHSMRPASGLGGSMAFEDAAVLCRQLQWTTDSIATTLAKFESLRLPRCRSISRDQTLRSTLAYKLGFGRVPAWNPVYREWIFQGPNASPEPPVDERAVFETVLKELEEQ